MATSRSHRRRPQFFKVLLPPSLEKLKIPPKFAAHLSNDNIADGEKASIRSPLGKVWHAELLKEGSGLFFGSGWKEFVRAHGLLVGFFLVFRYEGNLVFAVKVFDLSGCCKEYKIEEQKVVPSSSRKRKREKKEESSWNKSFPQLERIIRTYNIKGNFLSIPKTFCDSVGLSTKREVLLKNSMQRSWQVTFGTHDHYNFLARGWKEFCNENNIEVGDRCVFELVQENVFCVRVLKDCV